VASGGPGPRGLEADPPGGGEGDGTRSGLGRRRNGQASAKPEWGVPFVTRHEVGPRNPDTKFGRYLFLCHLVAVRHRQAHNVLTADLRRRLATHLAALLIRNDPLVQLRIEHHIHGLQFMNNPDVMISII
jgi:hypothetical protein